jgi:hypothetical protein
MHEVIFQFHPVSQPPVLQTSHHGFSRSAPVLLWSGKTWVIGQYFDIEEDGNHTTGWVSSPNAEEIEIGNCAKWAQLKDFDSNSLQRNNLITVPQ